MCQHFGVLPLLERLWLLNLLCKKQRKTKVEGLGEKKKGDSDREKERSAADYVCRDKSGHTKEM